MRMTFFVGLASALALAGCNSANTENTESQVADETPTASEAAPAETAATPAAEVAAGSAPTKEFMVGSWGDNGDCSLAIEFKADGSMVGPFEKWELDDKGVLTMVGNPQKMHLKVIDKDNMESRIDGTGEPHKINRC